MLPRRWPESILRSERARWVLQLTTSVRMGALRGEEQKIKLGYCDDSVSEIGAFLKQRCVKVLEEVALGGKGGEGRGGGSR